MSIDKIQDVLGDFQKSVLAQIAEAKNLTAEEKQARDNEIKDLVAKEFEKQSKERKCSLPGVESEKDFSWVEIVRSQVEGKWGTSKQGKTTQAIIEEFNANRKSSNTATGGAGGYLVPVELSGDIIDLAIARMPVMEFGPTVLRGLNGNLDLPKVTGRPTGYWVGEEETVTESNTTFGILELRPKTVAGFTKQSRLLLTQSSAISDRIIKMELAKSIALKWEEGILQGTGASGQPTGILNTAGLTSSAGLLTTNGARFRMDKAAAMMTNVDVANMLTPGGSFGFLMRPEVLSGMKRERVVQYSGQPEAQGMPVINPLIKTATLEDILDMVKIRTTTLLSNAVARGTSSTCSNVIFGDWSQLILAMWDDFEIVSSTTAGDATGSAMRNRQIWINAYQNVDVDIKDPTGFTVVGDAETLESEW